MRTHGPVPRAARVRVARLAIRALGVLLLVLLAGSCGRKGAPKPPTPHVPLTPENVVFRQRGAELEVRATLRLAGVGGRELEAPVRPVLLAFTAPSQQLAQGWDRSSRDREFLRLATRIPLEPLTLDRESGGARSTLRSVPVDRFKQDAPVVLALSLEDRRGHSLPSRRQVFTPARPPLAPLEAVSEAVNEDGITLEWEVPGDERVNVVRVYRRVGDGAFASRPWREVPASEGRVFDEGVSYGQDLSYRLVTALTSSGVAVESLPLERGPIAYRDVYPPDPVLDLEAVPATGAVRVLWFPGGSPDEAAAQVERQVEGEEGFSPLARVVLPDADYADDDVEPGQRYRYRVLALDGAGNASEPAGPTGWVSPRPERTPGDAP